MTSAGLLGRLLRLAADRLCRRVNAASSQTPYNPRVLLILLAVALAVFGAIHLAKPLEPRQRVVLVLVFVVGLVSLMLVQLGFLVA